MKKSLALLGLLLGLNAYAQTTTESVSTDSGILNTLRNSNIGLSLANEIKTSNKNNKINGFYNKLEGFVSYKMSPVDSFKLSAGYNVTDSNLTIAKYDLEAPSLRYKRSNILNEADHFVSFNSEARIYFYSNASKLSKLQNGNTSWRNTFSRKFTPDFKLATELKWDEYLRTTSLAKVARRKLVLTTSPVYNLTESLSFNPEVSLNAVINGKNSKGVTVNKEFVMFSPKMDYAFNKAFAGQLYWDSTPMVSRDQQTFADKFVQNGVIGAVLTYTIL